MRILIVEDDVALQQFLRNALESEMFAVDCAGDGSEAVKFVLRNDYDLVILDNNLPTKDGREVCLEIRRNNRTMPILVLSAQAEIDQKTSLLNAGADDYLTKPFELVELIARIRALMRRPTSITQDIIEYRGISLDVQRSLVLVQGKEVSLTRKEFMLLNYLMRNPDTVLTRAMILEHVWDMSVDIFSNTIESHILSLRKKISDIDKKDMLIKTIPGRGYKFSTLS
jgi:DNA-binding response OmpR family regulator